MRIADPHKSATAAADGRPLVALVVLSGALVAFVLVGMLGLYRYFRAYWLYRGFPPPHDPAFVQAAGQTEHILVRSAAIGGRAQRVDVYLPPGYDQNPRRRYPVFYLLHGFPGTPEGFLLTVRVGVVEDVLFAEQRVQPMILVMPFGSTGTFTDKEWANGVRPREGWETFVARDLVRAIDARYRTVPSGEARALGGLSEGGYGALNIGLHHPGEFRVLESWSGYEKADDVKSVFGGDKPLLARNSPFLTLPRAAPVLRRDRAYVWFYSGSEDGLRRENARFAADLRLLGISHRFFLVHGGHNWVLWRDNAWGAVKVASQHLADA